MPDLLLELFSEEIPARMQLNASSHLATAIAAQLKNNGLMFASYVPFVTPRRLAVWFKDLPHETAAASEEIKGPKLNAAEAALLGFLKKTGLKKEQLTERDGTYFATLNREGQKTADLLKPLIEEVLKSFPWPKSMRWGNGEQSWVRPLHSILCLFDHKVVPVSFAGVEAGQATHGHRFLSPLPITIKNPAEYERTLDKEFVIADATKRKQTILDNAQALAKKHGLTLREDAGLLEEVTGLVEWPVALIGSIDAGFMDLPPEVLVSEMRAHQKYFALETADGALADKFIVIANMVTENDGKAIIAGNERVLRARFSDARFFWDTDRKKPLDAWAEGLKSVTFHAKLGSIADKVERITKLATLLASSLRGGEADAAIQPGGEAGLPRFARNDEVQRAARLCKADLVTGMVGEFPELQGVMGRYYALQQTEPAAVADAIRDHYKPQGPGDSVPTQAVSICIALADKLDTLVSMFAIGEKPTGSKDPFALRRSALGMIRIILENNIRLSLKSLLSSCGARSASAGSQAAQQDPAQPLRASQDDVMGFFIDRLKVQLKDKGIRHDVINAVVSNGDDDIVRIVARAEALQQFLGSDEGMNLLIAYRRAANIIAIEEKKDFTAYKPFAQGEETPADPNMIEIYPAIQQTNGIQKLLLAEKFNEAMQMLAKLRTPVDRFFETTMINAEDPRWRVGRLRLLAAIRESMDSVADFSQIEG